MAHNIKWLFQLDTTTGQILEARTVASLEKLPTENTVVEGRLIKHIRNEDVEANSWTSMARTVDTWHWNLSTSSWVHRGEKPSDFYHIWSFSSNSWEYQQSTFLEKVREERGFRLFSSDWTQVNDSPLSDSVKEEWKAYRTLLRDFPGTVDLSVEPIDIATLNWPSTP